MQAWQVKTSVLQRAGAVQTCSGIPPNFSQRRTVRTCLLVESQPDLWASLKAEEIINWIDPADSVSPVLTFTHVNEPAASQLPWPVSLAVGRTLRTFLQALHKKATVNSQVAVGIFWDTIERLRASHEYCCEGHSLTLSLTLFAHFWLVEVALQDS